MGLVALRESTRPRAAQLMERQHDGVGLSPTHWGSPPFGEGGNGTVPLPSHHHDHGPNQTMQRELTTQKCKHVQNSRFPFQAQKKQGTETSLHWKYDLVCGGSMICLQRCSSETKRCGLFISQNCDGEKILMVEMLILDTFKILVSIKSRSISHQSFASTT